MCLAAHATLLAPAAEAKLGDSELFELDQHVPLPIDFDAPSWLLDEMDADFGTSSGLRASGACSRIH